MEKFLAENNLYKVISLDESVYLRRKSKNSSQEIYHKDDLYITWIYGNPTCALFLYTGKHLIIAGCGLTIYDIENNQETRETDT